MTDLSVLKEEMNFFKNVSYEDSAFSIDRLLNRPILSPSSIQLLPTPIQNNVTSIFLLAESLKKYDGSLDRNDKIGFVCEINQLAKKSIDEMFSKKAND